ncbi:hypothetical protein ACROYT_G019930 [Oculina patagonica]
MNLQHFIVNVLLIAVATAAVLDQEPPVFTYCPDDIVVDDVTTYEIRVYWPKPVATDNSGASPYLASNRQNGSLFAVPSSSEVLYLAKDDSGNEATCSFRITLKSKTCPLYAPPKNGALACNNIDNIGLDSYCAVMCNDKSDFVFNPPMPVEAAPDIPATAATGTPITIPTPVSEVATAPEDRAAVTAPRQTTE